MSRVQLSMSSSDANRLTVCCTFVWTVNTFFIKAMKRINDYFTSNASATSTKKNSIFVQLFSEHGKNKKIIFYWTVYYVYKYL